MSLGLHTKGNINDWECKRSSSGFPRCTHLHEQRHGRGRGGVRDRKGEWKLQTEREIRTCKYSSFYHPVNAAIVTTCTLALLGQDSVMFHPAVYVCMCRGFKCAWLFGEARGIFRVSLWWCCIHSRQVTKIALCFLWGKRGSINFDRCVSMFILGGKFQ